MKYKESLESDITAKVESLTTPPTEDLHDPLLLALQHLGVRQLTLASALDISQAGVSQVARRRKPLTNAKRQKLLEVLSNAVDLAEEKVTGIRENTPPSWIAPYERSISTARRFLTG
jgi:hypothetical protein